MPLPDPELELLTEILGDEPGNEVFLQVGRELIGRTRFEEAVTVLAVGLEHSEEAQVRPEGFALLADAALQAGQYLRALAALDNVAIDVPNNESLARIRVQVLEANGRLGEAREAAEDFLDHYPQDVVIEALVERLQAPPPDPARRLPDPFVSVERAEQYAALGRADRAIRVYRRLFFHFSDEVGFGHRVQQLLAQPVEQEDDLSEESALSLEPVPDLHMPEPGAGLTLEPPSEVTDPTWQDEVTDPAMDADIDRIRREIADRKAQADKQFVYGGDADEDPDEEVTQTVEIQESPAEIEKRIQAARKQRRSLIRS